MKKSKIAIVGIIATGVTALLSYKKFKQSKKIVQVEKAEEEDIKNDADDFAGSFVGDNSNIMLNNQGDMFTGAYYKGEECITIRGEYERREKMLTIRSVVGDFRGRLVKGDKEDEYLFAESGDKWEDRKIFKKEVLTNEEE